MSEGSGTIYGMPPPTLLSPSRPSPPRLCYDGIYHSQSEDTHWGEYVKVAFDYVNDKYPAPWDADTERLVAFLFGIISHQVCPAPPPPTGGRHLVAQPQRPARRLPLRAWCSLHHTALVRRPRQT
jgi:hypothetical protein